ncbi:MAG: hypothetical protein WKG07_34955 [Hymenobacter sp.]
MNIYLVEGDGRVLPPCRTTLASTRTSTCWSWASISSSSSWWTLTTGRR